MNQDKKAEIASKEEVINSAYLMLNLLPKKAQNKKPINGKKNYKENQILTFQIANFFYSY